jgi:hypothetical protein
MASAPRDRATRVRARRNSVHGSVAARPDQSGSLRCSFEDPGRTEGRRTTRRPSGSRLRRCMRRGARRVCHGATAQALLPVSRERASAWSLQCVSATRERTAARSRPRLGRSEHRGACLVSARPRGRGARTSPRTCREHSRSVTSNHEIAVLGGRAQQRDGHSVHGISAARPSDPRSCSTELRAWQRRGARARVKTANWAPRTSCEASGSERISSMLVRRPRQDRGETHDTPTQWFAPATLHAPWRASRLPWRDGAGAAARVA